MIQTLEDDGAVALRIATSGQYEDVVYVEQMRPSSLPRILEGDSVTVTGTCCGVWTYKSVMGSNVTLPAFIADSISIR